MNDADSAAALTSRGPRPDAAVVLTTYLVVLMGVPAVLVVGALGTAGSPSPILSLLGFSWWGWHHLHRHLPQPAPPHRVRFALVLVVIVALAAYAHAMTQPLPADELTPADSGLLRIVGLCGIALVACDGLLTLPQHRAVVRRLVLVVAAAALLGIVQRLTGQRWIDRIRVPGRSGEVESGLSERAGLTRPSASSTHPIEFGVVLTTALPLAVVTAQRAERHRWLYVLALGAVAIAITLTISRSATICAVVGMGVLALRWSARARVQMVAVTTLLLAAVYVSSPGVLGTIGNLFVGASDDSSVASRTGSYSIAWSFIERSPLLGRGPGTFLPKYWILDNQYLGLMIEIGLLGCLAVVALFVVAAASAGRAARDAATDADRDIARALQASVLAGSFGLAFFDTLAFPQSSGVLMVAVGLSAAARRLQPGQETQDQSMQGTGELAWSR
jgi:O-antigen ligase